MKISFVGAGGVGGYYGAMLARAGHDISFIARGAHLDAIRQNGLRIVGPLGDFRVTPEATSDPAEIGPVDVVVFTVKTYDNATAIPLITPLLGAQTTVLTLQNGVDSAEDIAAVVGKKPVIGGCTYIATAIEGPGVIRQTGTHRRVVLGEYFDPRRPGHGARPGAGRSDERRRHPSRTGGGCASTRCGRSSHTWRRLPRSRARRGCRLDRCGRRRSRARCFSMP